MKQLRINIWIPDEADPLIMAQSLQAHCFSGLGPIRLAGFELRIPGKKAWHDIAEVCDTCGELVDLIEDPYFRKHNKKMYSKHVDISQK